MATPEHPRANFEQLFRELTKSLGVADPNYPEGDEVIATSPYRKKFLRSRLVQADIEVILLIVSVPDHPFRNAYFTEDFEDLSEIASGGRIPAFMGVHGGVKVKVRAADAGHEITEKWADGDLAQSFDHLKTTRRKISVNRARYAKHPELYWIENGKIELTEDALSAKVNVPVIPVQEATNDAANLELFSPAAYANAVLAACISNLRIVGSNTAHRNDWTNIWSGYVQMIYGKALNLPEPERLQRVAG